MPGILLQRPRHLVISFLQLAAKCAAAVIVTLVVCFDASAQTTGSVVGKVTDPSGAVVLGVAIKTTNQSTSFSREATTDTSGEYLISLLPVGRYTITAQKQGFEPFTLSDVVVNVDENLRVDVPLGLGRVASSVDVSVVEVETRSATLGKVIDTAKIVGLPLNERNFLISRCSSQASCRPCRWDRTIHRSFRAAGRQISRSTDCGSNRIISFWMARTTTSHSWGRPWLLLRRMLSKNSRF